MDNPVILRSRDCTGRDQQECTGEDRQEPGFYLYLSGGSWVEMDKHGSKWMKVDKMDGKDESGWSG